jgi:hypothetical protein
MKGRFQAIVAPSPPGRKSVSLLFSGRKSVSDVNGEGSILAFDLALAARSKGREPKLGPPLA